MPRILTRIILVRIRNALFSKSWISGRNFPRRRSADPAADPCGGRQRVRRRRSDTWAHLARTVLGNYVLNTALLVAGVAAGVLSIGVLSRVAGHGLPLSRPARCSNGRWCCRSRCRPTSWPTPTPTGCSSPVRCRRRCARATGWQAREYWFPEIRSLGGAARCSSFALYPYVYLLARTAFLDISRSALEAGRLAGLSAPGAASGASRCRSRGRRSRPARRSR